MSVMTAPDPEQILRSHEARQAAIDTYRAAGRSDAWIVGWWRNQVRQKDD
jgi:hypothetical protein